MRLVKEVSFSQKLVLYFTAARPRAGSGVVRIDLLRFLAGCRTSRLYLRML